MAQCSGSGRAGSGERLGPLLGVGAASGVLGGLVGGGSGVVFVAALDRLTALTRAQVHGTSTIANIPLCAAGAGVYALVGGAIDLQAGTGMLLGGILGGAAGAWLLARTSETVLRALLVAVLVLTAVKFGLDAAGVIPAGLAILPAGLVSDPWFVVPTAAVAGVVVGAWAGAMGLGGGLLAVPVLALLFGLDLQTAAGTSLLIFVPNSVVGGATHARQGTGSWRLGLLLGLASAPGTAAGALIALALDTTVLGVVFGVFALIMAARETAGLVRRRRAPPS